MTLAVTDLANLLAPGYANVTEKDNQNSDDENVTRGSEAKPARRHRSLPARAGVAMVRLAIVSYVTILVSLVMMESRLVFPGAYMSDGSRALPESMLDRRIEDVTYTAADGVEVTGRLLIHERTDRNVMFFHGNASKAIWLDPLARKLSEAFDASVLLVEYRGFREEGSPSEDAIIADCLAARDYLCERHNVAPTDLILYGRSLGGGCAAAVAADGGAKALVMERTFDSLPEVAATKFPIVPVRTLMRNRFNSAQRLQQYDGPLVVVHGTPDRVVPTERGRSLYELATCQPKHWILVDGMGHNDALPMNKFTEVADKVAEFTSD